MLWIVGQRIDDVGDHVAGFHHVAEALAIGDDFGRGRAEDFAGIEVGDLRLHLRHRPCIACNEAAALQEAEEAARVIAGQLVIDIRLATILDGRMSVGAGTG